jgi:hypothetical protein
LEDFRAGRTLESDKIPTLKAAPTPASRRVIPAKASAGLAEMLGEDQGKMQGKTARKP